MSYTVNSIAVIGERMIHARREGNRARAIRTVDAVHRELFRTSPVRTGAFRRSFGVVLDGGPYTAGAKAYDVMAGWNGMAGVSIQTRKPYAGFLFAGGSRQAEAGWQHVAVATGIAEARAGG